MCCVLDCLVNVGREPKNGRRVGEGRRENN
jgi:hypothetical protein